MNDQTSHPFPNPSEHDASGDLPGGDYETAAEVVGRVIAWYGARIMAERRSGADAGRVEELVSRRRACLADQERLGDVSEEEAARIAGAYRSLLVKLESTEA